MNISRWFRVEWGMRFTFKHKAIAMSVCLSASILLAMLFAFVVTLVRRQGREKERGWGGNGLG